MGAEHPHRLAGLNQQSLLIPQSPERRHDLPEALPVARSLADTPVDDQVLWPLGDLGVEVVHQHPQCRFRQPAAARQPRAAGRPDRLRGRLERGVGHG